jgi:hypothetical protein
MAKDKCHTHQELDDGLARRQREGFSSALRRALNCGAGLVAERALTQILRRSRPLYSAPDALRERVAALVFQS